MPRSIRACIVLLLVGAGIGRSAQAQRATMLATVHGIAFDSLHQVPLANAFIVVVGLGRSATSDEHGHFRFDTLPPGTHTFAMQHDALDSLGLSAISARMTVGGDRDTVRLSIPSFARLWTTACGTLSAPRDSGFLFGTVRRADGGDAVNGASIQVQWLKVGFEKKAGVTQSMWGGTVRSDADGSYVVCGVPNDVPVRVRAFANAALTDTIDFITSAVGVRRLDLVIGDTSAGMRGGVIVGVVHDATGKPVAHATLSGNGMADAQSADDGSFRATDVPAGTRQVQARAIGLLPAVSTVTVTPGDTVHVTFQLARVTVLDSVKIKALAVRQQFVRDFEDRKRQAFARFVDSTTIEKRISLVGALLDAPQLKITRNGTILLGNCMPAIFIDKRRGEQADLRLTSPASIAMLEIYPHAMGIPNQFWDAHGGAPGCAIVVWTKAMFP